MFITISGWCLSPLQVSTTWANGLNSGPPLPALANTYSILSSVMCWCQCVHRVHADTDPTSVKCWASIAGAGQYPFNTEQSIFLAARDDNAHCTQDTPSECLLSVDPPSLTLVQPWSSIVSQRMLRFRNTKARAFNTKVGLMLGKWHEQRPNIKIPLRQHVG